MKNKRRTILLATIFFGIVLLADTISWYRFPEITFVNGNLDMASNVVIHFAFLGFILGLLLWFKANNMVIVPIAVLLFFIFFINSCAEVYPIETTTEPVDVIVLRRDKNGIKLIVREYKNAKTNRIIQDTVLVKDYFIFREIIESKNGHTTTNR
jgi:ABC-type transport system involved in multi-copper enzyme maturation permease subunit